MSEDITISDQVDVHVEGLRDFDHHVAIPAIAPLEAVFSHRSGRVSTRKVHGFNALGVALVLNGTSSRLVSVHEATPRDGDFVGVRERPSPAMIGPFSPAPPGMTAVFTSGERLPVVYYDSLGRAVLIGEDPHRGLYLAEEDEGLARIEGGPTAAPSP